MSDLRTCITCLHYAFVVSMLLYMAFPYSALTLLVGRQEGHPACKKLDVSLLVMIWLELCTSYSSSCHHSPPPSSLASIESRMEMFWRRLTRLSQCSMLYCSVASSHQCFEQHAACRVASVLISKCHKDVESAVILMVNRLLALTVKVRTLDIAPLHSESSPQKRSGMARVLKGSQFYLHTHTFIRNRNEPFLPLPSQL